LARHLARAGDLEGARQDIEWLVANDAGPDLESPCVGEAHYYLGRLLEEDGDHEHAIGAYESALKRDDRLVDAYARLEQLYRDSSHVAEADAVRIALETLEPEYEVDAQASDGWVLRGYDLDERALEEGDTLQMSLYWLAQSPTDMDMPGWYGGGTHWIQVALVENLAPNAGFERDEVTGSVLAQGWSDRLYGASAQLHGLVATDRGGEETTVAWLANRSERTNTGFCAELGPVRVGALYLQGIWMQTENRGHARFGVGCSAGAADDRQWSWLAAGPRVTSWAHFTGLYETPQNGSDCLVCASSINSTGTAYFDNALLVELEVPPVDGG
jgi:hypothetical protein